MRSDFDLTDVERPRTITAPYRFPPALPEPTAERCSPAQLVELAAGAAEQTDQLWALASSHQHVRAICAAYCAAEERHARDVRTLQQTLAVAQGLAATWQNRFDRSDRALAVTTGDLHEARRAVDKARNEHQVTALELEVARAELVEARRQLELLGQVANVTRRACAQVARSLAVDEDTVVIDDPGARHG